MNCPNCNKEISDNAKFCKYCGKKIENVNVISHSFEEKKIEENLFIKCPNCGKEMYEHKTFCTNCGNALNAADKKREIEIASEEELEKKPKGKKIKTILCLLCILMVGSATFAVVHFVQPKTNKTVANVDDFKEIDSEKNNVVKEEETEEDNTASESEAHEEIEDTEKENNTDADVETEVARIREIYNTIVSDIENNNYKEKTIDDGFVTYSDNEKLKAIVISKDYSQIGYACFYYFDDEKLVFAYYEGENAHRFYFNDEQMIRWRKSEDASKYEEGTNHDMEDTAEYTQWESTVKQNASVLKLAWNAAGTLDSSEDYIIPYSDYSVVTEEDIDSLGLSVREINYAKNEIYARHGRKFKSAELKEYFNSKSWYNGTVEPEDFQESWLNDIEKKNATFLTQLEEERGSYKLDR